MRTVVSIRRQRAQPVLFAPHLRAIGPHSSKTHPNRNEMSSPFSCLQTDSWLAQVTNLLISASLAYFVITASEICEPQHEPSGVHGASEKLPIDAISLTLAAPYFNLPHFL